MFEQLLKVLSNPVPADPPIWLFDPASGTDLVNGNATLSLLGGAVVNDTKTLFGHKTMYWVAPTSGAVVKLPVPLQLGDNWTIEWEAWFEPGTLSNTYVYEFIGDTTVSTSYLYTVWGDGGYSYQMRMCAGPVSDQSKVWRGGPARNNVYGVVRSHAFVCKGRNVSYYYNGVRQPSLINWNATIDAGKQVSTETFPMSPTFPAITQFRLGWSGSGANTNKGCFGRIRISDYPRYQMDYVPGELTL